MINVAYINKFYNSLELSNEENKTRALSFLSAVIAIGEQELLFSVLGALKEKNFDRKAIYEIVLQSYLFLGFPRMIEASIAYNEVYGFSSETFEPDFKQINQEESTRWFENGLALCKQVYGKNFERLKKRFISISPEMFRWMVIEGYGKVLSRPGLTSIERELAEVAALIIDKRERQLLSHIIGSLNVGADIDLIMQVNNDIRPLSGNDAYEMADQLISKVESSND